jgi:hypothetical protein
MQTRYPHHGSVEVDPKPDSILIDDCSFVEASIGELGDGEKMPLLRRTYRRAGRAEPPSATW